MLNNQKKKLGAAYKDASVPARILGLILAVVISVIAFEYIIPSFSNSKTDQLEDEYGQFADTKGTKVQAFNETVKERSEAVIEDPNSDAGKLALEADKDRVTSAVKSNKSVISAFVPMEPEQTTSLEDQLKKIQQNTMANKSNASWDRKPKNTGNGNREVSVKPPQGTSTESENENNESDYYEPERDVLANFTPAEIEALIQAQMGKGSKAGAVFNGANDSTDSYTSGGFVWIDTNDGNSTQKPSKNAVAKASVTGEQSTSGPYASTGNRSGELPTILRQGNKLSAASDYPVDSRFATDFVLTVNSGRLDGATLSCKYTRRENYLIPTCSDITFQNETVEISAIMLNPYTMGPVIDQYRDSETLLDWLGLLVTGSAKTYGENKLKQGTTTEVTDTQTVTTQNLTDSELIAGSVTTIIGSLSAAALQNFTKPDIINVPPHTPMIIALLKPLKAGWDLPTDLEPGVDFYE